MASAPEFACAKRPAKFHDENSTLCKVVHAKVVLHRLEGFPQQKMRDEQLPIKKEEDHFTWSSCVSVKREDLGVASEGAEPANASAWPLIKEEEPEFPQQQYKREEQSPIKKDEQNVSGSSGFRENLIPDGQNSVGLKKLPQIKEEEPEFPQQQMREEQLPIQKKEDGVTWSPGEALMWQDDLGGASTGVEPKMASTWLQIKEEEPEFHQQCKREEKHPIKNEDCVKWSTGEPFKSEDDLAMANKGAELLGGSSVEGWRAEILIAPLSDDDDLLFDNHDVEDVKKNPSDDKLCKCFQCGKTFGKKAHLKRHMWSHIGEKTLSCTFCGKTFTHKGIFNRHTRTHTGDTPFSCTVCGQRFTWKGSLIIHARTHTGEKPFLCSVCGKACSRKHDLQRHTRTHSGEKPFSCSVCGQTFTQKGHLISHARTHTGEKTFSCSVCGKTFTRKDHLNLHTRIHR
ncbi:uncharacterized protein LOC144213394 [Stigmatopora nigra]